MNARTMQYLLNGMSFEETEKLIEAARQHATLIAEDLLYNHESPMYRHCARSYGPWEGDTPEWRAKRERLTEQAQRYKGLAYQIITTEYVPVEVIPWWSYVLIGVVLI